MSVDRKVLVEKVYKNDHRLTWRVSGARLAQEEKQSASFVYIISGPLPERAPAPLPNWYGKIWRKFGARCRARYGFLGVGVLKKSLWWSLIFSAQC